MPYRVYKKLYYTPYAISCCRRGDAPGNQSNRLYRGDSFIVCTPLAATPRRRAPFKRTERAYNSSSPGARARRFFSFFFFYFSYLLIKLLRPRIFFLAVSLHLKVNDLRARPLASDSRPCTCARLLRRFARPFLAFDVIFGHFRFRR